MHKHISFHRLDQSTRFITAQSIVVILGTAVILSLLGFSWPFTNFEPDYDVQQARAARLAVGLNSGSASAPGVDPTLSTRQPDAQSNTGFISISGSIFGVGKLAANNSSSADSSISDDRSFYTDPTSTPARPTPTLTPIPAEYVNNASAANGIILASAILVMIVVFGVLSFMPRREE